MTVPPRSRGSARVRAEHSYFVRRLLLPAQSFIHAQAVSGIVLLATAIAAVVWANFPGSDSYEDVWTHSVVLDVGVFRIDQTLRHWASDGLMTFFFFVVALEIKRELVHGELSSRRKAALPVAAALGGMALPAVIYATLNAGGAGARGWGISMATDTAFALSVLALAGPRVPVEARIFLLALAIVDDIGAILVLAVFYTESLSLTALGVALLLLILIAAMNRLGVVSLAPYFVVGALIWVAVLKSGIHATIAGVALGALAPATPYLDKSIFTERMGGLLRRLRGALARDDTEAAETVLGEIEELTAAVEAPVDRLVRQLQPWVAYGIVPVFALANAGVVISGSAVHAAVGSEVTLGVVVGLLAGKAIGITAASWAAVRLGIASLPSSMNWPRLASVGVVAGMGFTVSLFFTEVSFTQNDVISEAKLGILTASIIAGALGYLLLKWTWRGAKVERPRAIELPG